MGLKIIIYPAAVLSRPANWVTSFGPDLARLTEQMFATMYLANGVGLAAPQVGIPQRVAIIDASANRDPSAKLVLVNPLVLEDEGRMVVKEGCLSVPGRFETMTRPAKVKVRAQNLQGEFFELEAAGLLCQALCHEIDHLSGTLYLDLLPERRQKVVRQQILRGVNSLP